MVKAIKIGKVSVSSSDGKLCIHKDGAWTGDSYIVFLTRYRVQLKELKDATKVGAVVSPLIEQ